MKEIQNNDAKISIYPDFSPELQRQRARFTECKRRLQQNRIKYAMFYPACLRITVTGENMFFSTPAELTSWMDINEGKIQQGEGE